MSCLLTDFDRVVSRAKKVTQPYFDLLMFNAKSEATDIFFVMKKTGRISLVDASTILKDACCYMYDVIRCL